MLRDDSGQWLKDRNLIGTHIADYFQRLFSSSYMEETALLEELIQPVISDEDKMELCTILMEKR